MNRGIGFVFLDSTSGRLDRELSVFSMMCVGRKGQKPVLQAYYCRNDQSHIKQVSLYMQYLRWMRPKWLLWQSTNLGGGRAAAKTLVCFCHLVHSGEVTREPTLRAFCFENSAKQSLLNWAGGSKPVSKWLKEETKQQSRNVVRE